jgi:hypothetical protein
MSILASSGANVDSASAVGWHKCRPKKSSSAAADQLQLTYNFGVLN